MPVAKYNKAYLMKCLGFNVGEDELARNIDNMGLNVEEEDKKELTLEFQANRPDLLSTVGLARAIRYFMRRSRSFAYEVSPARDGDVINVGKHVAEVRPYIAALRVSNMTLNEEQLRDIINLTERVSENYGRHREKIAMGLHDLRNVKPPFYYDAYEDEEFVPLNRRKPSKYSEVVKTEKKGKKYGALGSSEARYVALKDTKGTMSLIPILNSDRTKLSVDTKEMLLDVTGRNREVIEKMVDMLAAEFIDMGYAVSAVRVNYGTRSAELPRMESKTIEVPLSQLDNELGVTIGFNNVITLANKMGYEAALVGRRVRFKTPPYRLDIINEQDVIEDVAVAYGYDYIQPLALPATQQGSTEAKTKVAERMSDIMVGLGFDEAMNSYLTNEENNFKRMRSAVGDSHIKIENPKASTIGMLRTWLLPSLLKNVGLSMHDKLPIRLFELDIAFEFLSNAPQESYHLAAVACYSQANFNDIKAVFEGFARKSGMNYSIAKGSHPSFIEGRCATVVVGKKNIGFMGEIHPEVLTSFGIEEPVVSFEIDLTGWFNVGENETEEGNGA
ncbi:MAG: phenylalanine--tRNA ligase subunit beta [Candidatus Micrarchaeota archaeon]|nr:phenylalanine--tRNA ligase subunit beta [Candidatus Micrarchaeota archaeon]